MKAERIARLEEQWAAACNEWLLVLLNMWGLQAELGHWVGGVGTLYDYDGEWTLNMDSILFCVRKEVPIKVILDWQDYSCWAREFGFDTPTIDEFLKGKKIVGQEAREKLSAMKKGLEALCEEERERLNRQTKDEIYRSVYNP